MLFIKKYLKLVSEYVKCLGINLICVKYVICQIINITDNKLYYWMKEEVYVKEKEVYIVI